MSSVEARAPNDEAARSEHSSDALGRYRVGKQLAVGGMGTIYVAFDTLARREVAYKRLKVSSESARPRLTALFEREYNALRQLKHPSIVEVYDYGLDGEGPFYTMELLAGRDLASAAPLPLAEACRVIRDVASALALLHARRVVHRDVTPANVRLTEDGRAKLIDFGALSEFGVAKEIVGTPSFIAPECLSGEALDARTDLFSLGGVAYWALTRRHAYPARSIGELMDVWDIPVNPPSQQVPGLPREIDEIVLSLLERDPVARPASAAHVIERVSAVANLPAEHDENQVAYSYLMHPPLVGRAHAIEQLKRFASETIDGEGRTVMIESASGLGRSALLDQIAVSAQQVGANVLRFAPSGKRDTGLAQSIISWMRALFPDLWSAQIAKNPLFSRETRAPVRIAQSPGEVTEQRSKLVSAMQSAVTAMSLRAPLTLLVDDVHRADNESLALLASLSRIGKKSRLLLIMTREDRATGSDASALSDLRAVSTPVVLRPLSESDLATMVTTVFGDVPNAHRLARFLHAQSGGNPGQCMDLCRLLLAEKEIRYALGTFALPFDPRGDVLSSRTLELTRLTDLSEHALSTIRLVALNDSALNPSQVKSALGLDDEQLFSASEELATRGLVRQREGELSLASESLRTALRGSLAKAELEKLHGALAQCLLEHGDGTVENKFAACHHLLSADREKEAIALVWEPLRGSLLPLGSVASCVPVIERLLETMRRHGHPDEHCWMLLWPLIIAGYWGELKTVKRHREAGLTALANMTGIALANRMSPKLGKKLALIIGIFYGIFRFVRTPKRFRPNSYADGMQRFFSAVTMTTATAASAFEPEVAMQVAALLDPIEAMKDTSPGRIAREFAVATAETIAGLMQVAGKRYRWILDQLAAHKIFDEVSQAGFYDACTHGLAQAEVTCGSPDALALAEELARCHPFFRPHVETIKMTFHGYRGEKDLADYHRRQGELFALQGGLSWTAFAVLSIRTAYIAMVSQDTLGVLQAAVDLERVAEIAPNALLYRDLCRAYVAMTRGQPEAALEIYERIANMPHAKLMPAIELDAAFHAEALMRVGKLQEAKAVCEAAIAQRSAQGGTPYTLRLSIQQLAIAEAKLGEIASAKARLAELQPKLLLSEAPLPIGAVCRDQARIALMEGDAAEFDKHFAEMVRWFRKTKNQVLIQQCRKLLVEAVKVGLVAAPSWERHELVAPANTQDLSSEAPEVTELVETYS
jgi:serine/threonine protein kinase/tetratricopeptide (TPR) repeat protein